MGRVQLGQVERSAVNWQEAEIAASYHDLLRDDPDLARRTWQELMDGQQQEGLVMLDRPLCHVMRPRFITDHRREELCHIALVLNALFERAGHHLLASDAHLDLIGASEHERVLWEVDPGFEGLTLTSRLDSFMLGDHPKFVEYNAESPASIGFCDIMSRVFRALPALQQWRNADHLVEFEARLHLWETLLWAFYAWGGQGLPRIAIIDWDTVLTKRDFEMCADYFREQGAETVIVDPRALEYRQGKVWSGSQPVDLIYRRVLLHELLEKSDQAQPLLNAYRDGAVCMVNSPRSKLLHKKAVFALLSDRRLGLELTPEETAIVDDTIPWTRLVVPGPTQYSDETVDLVSFILREQNRMALKPVDDYGGHGVVLGWDVDEEGWARAVEEAVLRPYVVQERVVVPVAEFPVWQDDSLELVPLYVDTDPLLFRGQMGGILTRISGNPLLNVSAGTGSTVPTFMVRN